MRRALELARGVWGTTHPNPMVGAVIVEDGRIVAEGATAPDGGPHAERLALVRRLLQKRREAIVPLVPTIAEGSGQAEYDGGLLSASWRLLSAMSSRAASTWPQTFHSSTPFTRPSSR